MLGRMNSCINSDSTHLTEKINSSTGAHGLRYYNDKLQYYEKASWADVNSMIHLYRHLLTFKDTSGQQHIYHVVCIISTKRYTALGIFNLYQPNMSSGGSTSFGSYDPYTPPTVISVTEFARYSYSSYRYYHQATSPVYVDYCLGRVEFIMGTYDVVWTGTEHTSFEVGEIEF